uniref:Pyruvate phosphate dikinase AMP/ATP-binding domain-containing protein n=1 Tax=Physcomitrium patens TaxID=3218 RepID=A0A7I4D941_PHYPA
MKSFRAQSNRHSVSCLAGFQSVDVARGSSPRYVRFPFCTCSIIQALNIPGSERSFLAKNPHFLAKTISRRGQPPKRFSLISPRAAIATSSDVMGVINEFTIDDGIKLKVRAHGAEVGTPAHVQLEVCNCNVDSLLLHWGALQSGNGAWIVPGNLPDGSKVKHGAVQSPFKKSGDTASLKVVFDDLSINAIEFVLVDRNRNRWFKMNNSNLRIDVPPPSLKVSNYDIPEELVGVQAYLRWERKGRQNYSPEHEKVEYEAARKELQLELAQGVSITQLKARLLGGGSEKVDSSTVSKSDDNRVKPQEEIGEIKVLGKNLMAKVNRKTWSAEELLSRYTLDASVGLGSSLPPQEPTTLQKAAKNLEAADNDEVIVKKFFKVGGDELLVLATRPEGKSRIHIGTGFKEDLVIRWAVSKDKEREWMSPSETLVPAESTSLGGTVETQFIKGFAGDISLQGVTLNLGDNKFIGLPFVLRSGNTWHKDNGSDYYLPIKPVVKNTVKVATDGKGIAKAFLDDVATQERDAEKSLMHRYNIATELTERAKNEGTLALVGILAWLRYMATRQLVWNKNYNVKPREISAAQDRMTLLLQRIFLEQPEKRELVRLIMATVGRGGQGDVGQRIRDEILVIQRENDCKGGMMEEWHQKLHNNTSPDDVIICEALLNYIKTGFNMDVYWKTLNENGVTKERMLSYDRPVRSEPKFRADQKDGLIRDLTNYLRTLKAVHSGADLESAVQNCLGYMAQGRRHMGGLKIEPIIGLPPVLPSLLYFVLEHVEDKNVLSLLEGLLEARRELRPTLLKPHERLRDIIFLDLALESTVRTAVERGLESISERGPAEIATIVSIVVENLALSSDSNEELVYCLKDWYLVLDIINKKADNWALRTKAVLDRTKLALQDKAEYFQNILQPTADYLGSVLGVEEWAVQIFTEEMIRSGSAAALSQLLNRLDPVIRKEATMGSWQVISPVSVKGYVEVIDGLDQVQEKVYKRPTILVSGRVKGEEEIPEGVVAVLTPDMPDVLSHVSVRARNSKVCFATCFDSSVFSDLRHKDMKALAVSVSTNADLSYHAIGDSDIFSANSVEESTTPTPRITLKKKEFLGKYAVSSKDFNLDLSRNIANLMGKLPSWIRLPTSVAVPFGVFEKVLTESVNKDVASEIAIMNKHLYEGDYSKLTDIRKTVLRLEAPPALIHEIEEVMKSSGMPWPGDESEERWKQAWTAIKRVWASKWNERAYFSTRKTNIDHSDLCMAVLVQEIIQADYAFVIHTTNPSTGDETEIYAEVVKGLGETLVGAYSGRALSFVTKKSDMKNPKVPAYPSTWLEFIALKV